MTDYTILLIDYAPRSVAQLSSPLQAAGYTVEVADNGQLGLEVFARIKPDLAMIEPMLPKRHGFEVCKEIKESDAGRDTPILILTSIYQGRRYRDQAQRQSQCDGFLDKPIRAEALLATVAEHLQGREPRSSHAGATRTPAAAPIAPSIAPQVPLVAPQAQVVSQQAQTVVLESPDERFSPPPSVEPTLNRDLPLAAAASDDGNGVTGDTTPPHPLFSEATEAEILDRLDAIMPD